jgi:hypothetical protein
MRQPGTRDGGKQRDPGVASRISARMAALCVTLSPALDPRFNA